MASIVVLKRTRATVEDDWSEWLETTDPAPYTDTDLVEYKVESKVALEDLTDGHLDENNDWRGTGVFDELMEAVNLNIEGQYNKKRIDGSDYATVYLGAMQSVISESIRFLLDKDKATNLQKQGEVLTAQKELYERQKEAFDDNKYQKLFEAQLNYNGMVFQDASDPDILDVALEQKVNDVFNKLTKDDPITSMPEV